MSAAAAPWVRIGDQVRSQADLRARAAQAAQGFVQAGVAAGDVVAVLLRNDFALVEASVGAGMAGAYVVPVNWHNTADEVLYVLNDSGAKVLVAHADLLLPLAGRLPPGLQVLVVTTPQQALRLADRVADGDAQAPTGLAASEGSEERDACEEWEHWLDGLAPLPEPHALPPGSMIYTSGTTGHPKGVRRTPATPAQAAANFALMCRIGGLEDHATRLQDVRMLIPGPAYHSSPNGWLFALFRQGANIVLEPRFDPVGLLRRIAAQRITHVLAVPTMFVRLLALPEAEKRAHDLSSLVHVMHVGAPCPPHVKRAMIDWWGPVIGEHFGSTEVGAVTCCTAQEWLDHPGTVGRVLDGMTVQVLGPDGLPLPPGQSGEVACGRDNYPDFSYHGDDAKRQKAARGPGGTLVATGDMGYFDADGYLYLDGRASDMIIFGGSNIYPAEVEQALMRLPGVADCAVFGIPDPEFGEQVCAFVQAAPGARLDAGTVLAGLRPLLASYKLPRRIEFVPTLPREDTGKLFKRRLRDPFWAGTGRQI